LSAPQNISASHRLLRLSASDNVLVATGQVDAGLAGINGGGVIDVLKPVTLGHKIAARRIEPGEKIIKYGVPIGSATSPIEAGEHVHVHNMKSDYTPTHALTETADGDT